MPRHKREYSIVTVFLAKEVEWTDVPRGPTRRMHRRMREKTCGPETQRGHDTPASPIQEFKRDGFVVVPGLFDTGEMQRISAWTDELQGLPEVPGRQMMYFEPSLLRPGERVLQRIENFCPFHEGFAALCDGEAFMEGAEVLNSLEHALSGTQQARLEVHHLPPRHFWQTLQLVGPRRD